MENRDIKAKVTDLKSISSNLLLKQERVHNKNAIKMKNTDIQARITDLMSNILSICSILGRSTSEMRDELKKVHLTILHSQAQLKEQSAIISKLEKQVEILTSKKTK